MNKYVVLLRGINVGGNNKLPMKELVVLLEDNGFQNVKTYIQSGNIIVDGNVAQPEMFSKLIKDNFGIKLSVVVLSEDEFCLAVKRNPFQTADGKYAHLYFCQDTPILDKEKLRKYSNLTEETKLIGKVFYLYAPDGIGRSKLVMNVEACLGMSATGRNLNTVKKLHALLNSH